MTNDENNDPFIKALEAVSGFEESDLESLDRYLMVIQYGLNGARQSLQAVKKTHYN